MNQVERNIQNADTKITFSDGRQMVGSRPEFHNVNAGKPLPPQYIKVKKGVPFVRIREA